MKHTMATIQAANRDAGFHFFSRDTMQFFDSKVEPTVYQGIGGVYFLTSEQFTDSAGTQSARKWTVRAFNPATADIRTVSQFNQSSLEQAREQAKQFAKHGIPEQTVGADNK